MLRSQITEESLFPAPAGRLRYGGDAVFRVWTIKQKTRESNMKELQSSFNLVDEPWISVVYTDGSAKPVSLTTLFEQASQIREIAGDIPQQTLPILRLALAILYRAYYRDVEQMSDQEWREDWAQTWADGKFDMADIREYLQEFHDRFNLLDPQFPFFQTPGLEYTTDKDYDPVSEIIADVPKPEKYLFSLRAKGTVHDLSLAEAARWLVFLQSYDTAGIKTPVAGNTHVNKGKVYPPKGAVGTGWLGALGGVYLEGQNLFQTLMLNWCLLDSSGRGDGLPLAGRQSDKPVWEQQPAGTDMRMCDGAQGSASLFTWQDRRIRLIANEDQNRVTGMVICYGDSLTAVNKHDFESMTAWRENEKLGKELGLPQAPLLPRSLDSSKALWRGLEPLLKYSTDMGRDLRPGVIEWIESVQNLTASSLSPLNSVTIHAQGMSYGTQNSVFEDAMDDRVDIHAFLLRHDAPAVATILDIVQVTDKAVYELSRFVHLVEQTAGDKSKDAKAKATSTDVKERAYDELDPLFRRRIADFAPTQDPGVYGQTWKNQIHRLLLDIGREYLLDSSVSPFTMRDAGTMKHISAADSEVKYASALNKLLGELNAEKQQ
ncbi:CRISPR-associated protein CasA [Bombiscardovia nodaiensis]|uniref:CRISPR-associated protein CasA n=1 Tax=Bombiscardovia nodaiensis TaxID=2932181 RepID=A0ABN6S819_9BIFI|nr:CRISPR-associated protein CasA [Bombiscardovia nodaiensis]